MDILRSELFLERLHLLRSTGSEYYRELLITEHLHPLMFHIIGKAYFLPNDDIIDAVSDAVRRAETTLNSKYDPERFPPFKFYGRIAYNERNRAVKSHNTSKRFGDISIHDTDYESEAVYADRKSASKTTAESMDFKRLLAQIPDISEDHRLVFESLVYGEGVTRRSGRPSVRAVATETGLLPERVKEVMEEVRVLIRGISGDSGHERQKADSNVDSQDSSTAGRKRRERQQEVLRPRYSYTQTEIPLLFTMEPGQKAVDTDKEPMPPRNPRRSRVLGSDNVRKHRRAMETHISTPGY